MNFQQLEEQITVLEERALQLSLTSFRRFEEEELAEALANLDALERQVTKSRDTGWLALRLAVLKAELTTVGLRACKHTPSRPPVAA